MEQRLSVILADSDERNARCLAEFLESNCQMEVVAICSDGKEAFQKTMEHQPDCLLLDLIMPVMDGLTVLELLKKSGCATSVIVASELENSNLIHYAFELGTEVYVCKPYDYEVVYHRLLQMAQRMIYQKPEQLHSVKEGIKQQDEKAKVSTLAMAEQNEQQLMMSMDPGQLEYQVTNVIRRFGIPAHIKGYQYIREGIMMSIKDEEMLSFITKFLYPAIAKEFHTTASSVERAIRHAIGVAWERGNAKAVLKEFGYYHGSSKRPTNCEFLSTIVDSFRMEQMNASQENTSVAYPPKAM